MPLTFSTGSFSFLKSSTGIKQNNNVDNVNKNINGINDSLDIGIPSERKVRSLDNPITSFKNNRRNSNNSNNINNNNNKKVWLKLLFVRIHHTLSRWNDNSNINDDNDNNRNDHDCSNNLIENNNGVDIGGITRNIDDPMMKSKDILDENTFICHGNTHDFTIVTKNCSLKPSVADSKKISTSSSSVFEKCAQTPRHFAKEPEVLGKVGRFTIVREREDFDTTYFDQCHCQQKPCRFSTNGCCGSHPTLPPELLPQFDTDNDSQNRQHLTQQQIVTITNSSSKSRRSLYCNPSYSTNSSRHSLSSLQNNNNNINNSNIIMPSKVTSSSSSSSSIILPQSSSSPNLVHLHQRSKNENIQNKNLPSRNNRSNMNIIVGGNSGKYPPNHQNNNSHYYSQCTTTASIIKKKVKRSSLINIKATEEQQRRLSMPSSTSPPTPPTPPPTTPSKFYLSFHNNSNEPHTTINSHSGRKFEVEWNRTTKSSSSSSTSSSSSSDIAYSPPSTMSSVFSMASSPDKSIKSSPPTNTTDNNTLSRRCSTLSSKCGRKFEVTFSSSGNNNSSLLNTSPNSTIISSSVETTEFSKVQN